MQEMLSKMKMGETLSDMEIARVVVALIVTVLIEARGKEDETKKFIWFSAMAVDEFMFKYQVGEKEEEAVAYLAFETILAMLCAKDKLGIEEAHELMKDVMRKYEEEGKRKA